MKRYTFSELKKIVLRELWLKRIKKFIPLKLNHSLKFKEIASLNSPFYFISCTLSMNGLYYIWGKVSDEEVIWEPKETQFNSFNEIFYHFFGTTYKLNNEKFTQFNDDFIRNGFYDKEFDEQELLGSRNYGVVAKVKKESSNDSFDSLESTAKELRRGKYMKLMKMSENKSWDKEIY